MSAGTIVIVDGARTPVGSFGGVSKEVPADELGATAARAALARRRRGERHPRGPHGLHRPGGTGRLLTRGGSPSRPGCLPACLRTPSPALRLRGPGNLVRGHGDALEGFDLALAGGDESMTRMPFCDFGARSGYKLVDRSLVDGTVMMLPDPFNEIHMGVTAENVAQRRAASDDASPSR